MNDSTLFGVYRPTPLQPAPKKIWRTLKVDIGLPEAWLETVNSLKYWKVPSSCEGHVPPYYGSLFASIALAPRHPFLDLFAEVFRDYHSDVSELAQRCFEHPDTHFTIKCFVDGVEVAPPIQSQSTIRPCAHVVEVLGAAAAYLDNHDSHGTILNLSIIHTVARASAAIPPHVLEWLDRVASGLISFDHQCAQLCSPNCESHNKSPV